MTGNAWHRRIVDGSLIPSRFDAEVDRHVRRRVEDRAVHRQRRHSARIAGHRQRVRLIVGVVTTYVVGDAEVAQPGRYAKRGHPRGGCVYAVRLELCRRCGIQFAVCRSCDRGQRHCTRSCAAESRRLDLAEIRRRYRRSPAGRDAHREQERRRRGRLRAAGRMSNATDADSVGDHTSQVDVAASSVDSPRRAPGPIDAWSKPTRVQQPQRVPLQSVPPLHADHVLRRARWLGAAVACSRSRISATRGRLSNHDGEGGPLTQAS